MYNLVIIDRIIKKNRHSFIRREEKRGKNNQFIVHLLIKQIITIRFTLLGYGRELDLAQEEQEGRTFAHTDVQESEDVKKGL